MAVAWATPCWPVTRPLLAASRTVPPARWAAMPARLTGVQRFQPALATSSRCLGSWTWAAAPLRPTAPMSDPPNQVARPRSCRERARVLSLATVGLPPSSVAGGRLDNRGDRPLTPTARRFCGSAAGDFACEGLEGVAVAGPARHLRLRHFAF